MLLVGAVLAGTFVASGADLPGAVAFGALVAGFGLTHVALTALAAQVLLRLIALATNVAFYGRLATEAVSPAGAHRGPVATVLIPVAGALVVGAVTTLLAGLVVNW